MARYIAECSKYFITGCMILYTIGCFGAFAYPTEKRRGWIYNLQCALLFVIQFLSYLTLCLRTGQLSYLFFYGFLQIAIFATLVLYHTIYPDSNRLTINNMCMLLSIGFILLARLDFSKAVKQLLIVAASMAVALCIPYFIKNLKLLKNLKWVYALLGVAALLAVMILGQVTHGSKISYSIGGITFQPSEIVKILFVFCIASMLCEAASIKEVFISAIVAASHVLILVLSKDLGSALIFFVGYVFLVYIASHHFLYLLAGVIAGCMGSVVAYRLFSHVQVRVLAWKDPWSVIDKEGYQITQSLFAIGSGNWFGLGLGKGASSDIPYVETDFIFSAITEEMGVIFSGCVILVSLSSFLMILRLSMKLKDRFYRLLASGIGVMYIFQVFLTVGGGTKFIPLTGVTLPFISYGGTSVLTTLAMFAIVQGLFMIREEEARQQRKRLQKIEHPYGPEPDGDFIYYETDWEKETQEDEADEDQ